MSVLDREWTKEDEIIKAAWRATLDIAVGKHGMERVSGVICKNQSIINKYGDPTYKSDLPSLHDMFRLCRLAESYMILHVLADICGHSCTPRRAEDPTKESLATLALRATVESADVSRALLEAVADGSVTKDELIQITKEADEAKDAMDKIVNAAAEKRVEGE